MTGENNFLLSAFECPMEPDPKPTAGIGSPARGTLMFFGSGFSPFTHQENEFFSVTSFTETAAVPSGNKEREFSSPFPEHRRRGVFLLVCFKML